MPLSVRYHGRVCLLGEHCDWAGGASLTAPVPLWVAAAVEPRTEGLELRTSLHGELMHGLWPLEGGDERGPLRFVPAAARYLARRGIPIRPARLWVHATLPAGRGLSSSAAFTLAILDALTRHAGHVLSPAELAEAAYVVEHDLLGVACGRLDQLACAAGGPLYLRWHDGRAAMRPVQVRGRFHLVVGVFPGPRDAGAILSALDAAWHADLCDRAKRRKVEAVYVSITEFGAAAVRGTLAIESGDAHALGAAMDAAQEVYEAELEPTFPELRAPRLRRTCWRLRDMGALGAKFSGAGGDGSVVALFRDREAAETAAGWMRAQGLAAWYVPLQES